MQIQHNSIQINQDSLEIKTHLRSMFKDSAVNRRAVLLIFLLFVFCRYTYHISLNVTKLCVEDHSICVVYPSVSRSTISSKESASSLSWPFRNSWEHTPLIVVNTRFRKNYALYKVMNWENGVCSAQKEYYWIESHSRTARATRSLSINEKTKRRRGPYPSHQELRVARYQRLSFTFYK